MTRNRSWWCPTCKLLIDQSEVDECQGDYIHILTTALTVGGETKTIAHRGLTQE